MNKLNLNFLDESGEFESHPIYKLLDDIGRQVVEYSKGYFVHIMTTGSWEGVLHDISLYLIAPEIKYDYKVVSIEMIDIENVKLMLYSLTFSHPTIYEVNIKQNLNELESKLLDFFNGASFNSSSRMIVNQINEIKNSEQ